MNGIVSLISPDFPLGVCRNARNLFFFNFIFICKFDVIPIKIYFGSCPRLRILPAPTESSPSLAWLLKLMDIPPQAGPSASDRPQGSGQGPGKLVLSVCV